MVHVCVGTLVVCAEVGATPRPSVGRPPPASSSPKDDIRTDPFRYFSPLRFHLRCLRPLGVKDDNRPSLVPVNEGSLTVPNSTPQNFSTSSYAVHSARGPSLRTSDVRFSFCFV